jgi:SNF2 family DNA or RNA helicase
MITIEYIESHQLCRLQSDVVDNNWKTIRSYYNQISDQSEIYEDSVELPWHAFIANLSILADIRRLFGAELTFTSTVERLLKETVALRRTVSSISSFESVPEDQIEAKLVSLGFSSIRKLTKEQIRNLSKLSRLPFGATFSVPGAGKTTEAIAFYLLHRKEQQKLFVICPKSAFPAWEEQLATCIPEKGLEIIRLTGGEYRIQEELTNRIHDVFLISYQQFNRVSEIIAKYLHLNHTFVFIDESHRMKGGERRETGRQIQRISHLPVGKLIMSGTPMPQGISDLIPQYSFLFPTDGEVTEQNVKDKFDRIYVRTTKNELLDPKDFPLNIIKTPIPLHEPQRYLYNLIRSEELRQLSGINQRSIKFYRQLGKSYIRLLQVVSNPSLLLRSMQTFPDSLREAIEFGDSNKIRYTVLRARQLAKQGKKVLIWSGFVENVETITSMLADLGAKCIHGGVEAGSDEEEDTREGIVKEFHDNDQMQVLVANPAACSEGISLHTVCHHAIYVDRNYNAAQFLQSMDRIHRLGLPKGTQTIIEIIHSPDSIDDLIDFRLTDKVRRMADVLKDPSLNIEPVTIDLDKDGFDEFDAKQLLMHLKSI